MKSEFAAGLKDHLSFPSQSEALIASEAERNARLQNLESHLAAAKASLEEKVQSVFGCCTADSQADEDRIQLNNNLKMDELETLPVTVQGDSGSRVLLLG